ncbi:MAG: hypothetical protein U9R52_04265, partial [Candidatus Omnitrophota bacterium]|nr:hypothetical protein [Candidatus Omnitrophota bacterium]
EALIFLTAKCGGALAERRSADFLRKHNGACLRINGADLKKLGIKPGPEFARILKKTLYAKIDGKLRTRKDELFFAKREVL